MGRDDVIAALATPVGEGALAVVRLSGRGSVEVADRIFRGAVRLSDVSAGTIHFGRVVVGEEEIDQVVAAVYRAPRSFTGEDCIEVTCHGGMYVTARVLEAVLGAGARSAEPGEFTKRAFLNGRIDLAQAEAVAALIAAKSERARRLSVEQLEGRLGRQVGAVRESLISLCALLELDLDFAEDGIEVVAPLTVVERLEESRAVLMRMASTFEEGAMIRAGVHVVIVGRPNAGKSSLFNALLKVDRAIVTHLPGTTRDVIEEEVIINGMSFRLSDTAGLRAAEDLAEAEGVSRSKARLRVADVVLAVVDAVEDPAGNGIAEVGALIENSQKVVVAFNKIDIAPDELCAQIRKSKPGALCVSAKTGEGVRELLNLLSSVVGENRIGHDELPSVMNQRHWKALTSAAESLERASEGVGVSNEFIALDVREACNHLSEITGEITSEEVLNSIFNKFCIGK